MSEDRPARPSDIARAALEAARAASAARPRPTRRRIAGPRRAWTGAGPGADDPQPLGRLVDSLVSDQDWTAHTRVGAVFGRWDSLVGADIAAHCRPETLTEGELLVVAESTAWATQLRLLAPTILGRLRAQVGGDVVTRLRVVGPTAPSWKKGPRSVGGGGPPPPDRNAGHAAPRVGAILPGRTIDA
jgi:predicted nucleic acid-binding Zn ribbon protein